LRPHRQVQPAPPHRLGARRRRRLRRQGPVPSLTLGGPQRAPPTPPDRGPGCPADAAPPLPAPRPPLPSPRTPALDRQTLPHAPPSQATARSRVRCFEMTALRSLLVLVALVTAASSCAAPLQQGGVEVHPGVQARLDLMCRYRPGGNGTQDV